MTAGLVRSNAFSDDRVESELARRLGAMRWPAPPPGAKERGLAALRESLHASFSERAGSDGE